MDTRSKRKQKYLSKKNQASNYFETFKKRTNHVNATDRLYLKVTRKGRISMGMYHVKDHKAHEHPANGDAKVKDDKVVRDAKAKPDFHAHNALCSIRLENGGVIPGLQMVRLLLRKGDGLDDLDVVNESFQFIPTHFNFNDQVHGENDVFEDITEIVIDQRNASINSLAKLIGKSYLVLCLVECNAALSRQSPKSETLKDARGNYKLNEKDTIADDAANHPTKEKSDKVIAQNDANCETNENDDIAENDDGDNEKNKDNHVDDGCDFDANALNDHGQTQLGVVAHCGQLFLAQFLIENGADVNQPNEEGSVTNFS